MVGLLAIPKNLIEKMKIFQLQIKSTGYYKILGELISFFEVWIYCFKETKSYAKSYSQNMASPGRDTSCENI